MKNLKVISALIVTLLASTSYTASGAAAVVARAAGKSYSEPTRQEFLNGCLEGVEAPICECVLKKLEGKYDENLFKSLESRLSLGIEDKDYVDFIVNSTTECSIFVDGPEEHSILPPAASQPPPQSVNTRSIAGFQVTDEEIMFLKAMLQSPLMKETFVQTCTVSAMEWLGTTQADKTCSCAYDKLSKDSKIADKLLSSGSDDLSDFGTWGFEYVESCLPKQFPKEMDNAFLKECMKVGDVKKSTCDCVLKSIKKDYNVKSLLRKAFEDSKILEMEMTLKATQCLAN